mmetsp:Transcript_12124/g.14794  ORF Transcript_12124/g.14794 Transcript_12124/m.14794 type:complete len:168 (-) Transcript_12124:580-1083(-)
MVSKYLIFFFAIGILASHLFVFARAISVKDEIKHKVSDHARRLDEEVLTRRNSSGSRDMGGKGHSGKGQVRGKGDTSGKGDTRTIMHYIKPGNQQSNDTREDDRKMDRYYGLGDHARKLESKSSYRPTDHKIILHTNKIYFIRRQSRKSAEDEQGKIPKRSRRRSLS